MKYDELPWEVRDAVEQYNSTGKWAGDCFEQALTIAKDHEAAIRALMEAYGEWTHRCETMREKLEGMGYDAQQIGILSFLEYYPDEAKKRELPEEYMPRALKAVQ